MQKHLSPNRQCTTRHGTRPARYLLAFCLLLACPQLSAELIFGATIGNPSDPDFRVFRATGGNVTQVPLNLDQPLFPSLSPAGNLLIVSSPDPAQPFEASQDLFAFDLNTGLRRKLWNNVTQSLPDGGFLFATPMWSATSSNGQRVAFVNQTSATSGGNDPVSGGVRQLRVIRASDGFEIGLAEIGNGSALDLFQSEFVGISWQPGTDFFATPAYIGITNSNGQPVNAVGIVLYGPTGPPGQPYVRSQILTLPSVVVDPNSGVNVFSNHAYPAFSPNGQQLAFFRITFPLANLAAPAQADLIVISTATGSGQVIASFNPGFFPAGLSWRNNASLVFSLGTQFQSGGIFLPSIVPSSAQILTTPATGGSLGQIPGVGQGFFPNPTPPSEIIFRNRFE
ncbi:MAG: hypothetical protein JJU31_16540 [Wenzhouxiangella sp.]|nr:hypothetical protein [Wenzhouxiangella sp.]